MGYFLRLSRDKCSPPPPVAQFRKSGWQPARCHRIDRCHGELCPGDGSDGTRTKTCPH